KLPLPRPLRLIGQVRINRWRGLPRLGQHAGGGGPLISEIVALAHIETIVVSAGVVAASPPLIRFPMLTWWLLMRPVSGAVILVNPTLSSAERMAALADSTAAVATFRSETRWS